MEVDLLVQPVAEQPPCGPNLEDDPEFQALEVAARGKDERVIGDKHIAAVPPAWPEVRDLSQRLFTRTKDLRVAILWTRAAVALAGLSGLRDGIGLTVRLLESHWDAVHPQVDPADNDPAFRMNVLAGLVDPATILREIRHATLAEVPRKGRVTMLDVLVATGKLQPAGESARTLPEVQGLLQEAAASQPAGLETAGQAERLVVDLQKLLTEKVGSDRMPDLRPLRQLLAPAVELCRIAIEAARPATTATAVDREIEGAPAVAAPAGAIRTREDAIRMLDRVCEYMERNEPASPAPLLIRRAQRLMNKNFMEIIQDLSPDSVVAIKALGGIKD